MKSSLCWSTNPGHRACRRVWSINLNKSITPLIKIHSPSQKQSNVSSSLAEDGTLWSPHFLHAGILSERSFYKSSQRMAHCPGSRVPMYRRLWCSPLLVGLRQAERGQWFRTQALEIHWALLSASGILVHLLPSCSIWFIWKYEF